MARYDTPVKDWKVLLRSCEGFNKGTRRYGYRTLQQGVTMFTRKKKNGCKLASRAEIIASQAKVAKAPAVTCEYAMKKKVIAARPSKVAPNPKPEPFRQIDIPTKPTGRTDKAIGMYLHHPIVIRGEVIEIGRQVETSAGFFDSLPAESDNWQNKDNVCKLLGEHFPKSFNPSQVVWYI